MFIDLDTMNITAQEVGLGLQCYRQLTLTGENPRFDESISAYYVCTCRLGRHRQSYSSIGNSRRFVASNCPHH